MLDRRELMAALLEAGTAVVLDADGVATGFAVLRRIRDRAGIGPVVARDAAGARALIGRIPGGQSGPVRVH